MALTAFNYFLPIMAFLLVFVVVYALLKKTKVLGASDFITALISFILAAFFVVNTELVEFVSFSSSWFSVIVIAVFLGFVLLAFFPGGLDFLKKGWVSWVVLILIIVFFIISSSFVFNWAVNWGKVYDWFFTDWFSFVLLLVIAAITAWILTRK